MTALIAAKPEPVRVEDYLRDEQLTDTRHEYLGGQVVAMGGASDRHGLIAGELFALLKPSARRKGCQVFIADMKVRIDHDGASYFYYPDVLLSCDAADRESAYYRRSPCFIAEVLSPTTERIDSREKLLAYRLLPSLREYLLLRQDRMQADFYQRRDDGQWQHQCLVNPDELLVLACVQEQIALRDVYLDVPELIAQG